MSYIGTNGNLNQSLSVCSICTEAVSGLVAGTSGAVCGVACALLGPEMVPVCAGVCGSIASGETDAAAICASVDLC